MPRFFVDQEQIDADIVRINGDDAHHIARSLRMAVGERIIVCATNQTEYECELTEFLDDREVRAKILSAKDMHTEPPFVAHLYQALPKHDKLDTIIQKAVECGVCAVTPFESERCVVRCKAEQEEKKTERRRRIATEAAKQCGRGIVPQIYPTCTWESALQQAARADIALFCYEGETTMSLRRALRGRPLPKNIDGKTWNVSIMIGSEGGFSPEEAERARQAGLICVGLGPRILRTETASSFVLSAMVYEWELERSDAGG